MPVVNNHCWMVQNVVINYTTFLIKLDGRNRFICQFICYLVEIKAYAEEPVFEVHRFLQRSQVEVDSQ